MNEEDAINNQDPDKDLLEKIQGRLAVTNHLDYDPQTRDLLQRAHARITHAMRWEKKFDEWRKEGETLVGSMAGWIVMFHIGHWWADRPWRKRPE